MVNKARKRTMRVFHSSSPLVRPSSPWLAVATVLVLILMGAWARAGLPSLFDARLSFLVFVPAVVAGSALGGVWPGALAAGLGVATGLLLGDAQPQVAEAALFLVVAGAVTWGGEWFQRVLKELSSRETHLRLILDTVPDAMILIDEKGAMRAFSPTAERLFGWTAAEAIGQNVSLLMPAPHREAHDSYLERYYRTGERRIVGVGRVVVGRRKDGSDFPLELAVGEMRTKEGRFFTGFVRDLTERQQAEARMQELQADLIRVSRLTALGEMASALAHELNQPLTAITNYLKGAGRLLRLENASVDRVSDAVDRAAEQALRAGVIIRRLREFVARGETERRIENLHSLIEEASALALVGAREHGVQVRFALDPSADLVIVDRVQIQQVLLNLIRNAMDAMQDGGTRDLAISASTLDEDHVQVTVSDTGAGIDPYVAVQLFQPFITTKRAGMGVGLSISRTIMEAHGGRLWFEANAAGGADFHFTLHRARLEEELA